MKKKLCIYLEDFLLSLILPSASNAIEKVTIQLCWDHQFQFAGY